MAYKTTVGLSCANRQVALDAIWTQLAAMGWTLVDGNFTALTMAYTAVSVADDTFTTAGTVPPNATPVQITTSGAVPTGLAINTLYYIVNRTDTTFKLSATYNGAAINLTAQGSGNHTVKEAFRVYSSNGENADKIAEYIQFLYYVATTSLVMYAGYSYTVNTKVLTARASTNYNPTLTTSESGFYLWIYGDKSNVFLATKVVATMYATYFGHAIPFFPLVTALTADASSGSAVTITVTSTEGFEAGYSYQILGAAGEGRDTVVITSITSSTQMEITSLPRNFATGARIGITPSTFYIRRLSQTLIGLTCSRGCVGITDAVAGLSYGNLNTPLIASDLDLEYQLNKYVLQPWLILTTYMASNSYVGITGYIGSNILASPATGLVNEDTISIGVLDSGTSSGSNSSSTFNNTAKSWTVNAYANKVLIITFGAGIGQIVKIASNSATQLVLADGWTFLVPTDATSQYNICTKGYRYLFDTMAHAVREGY